MEAADVDDFWTFATRMGLRGASVTAPFKEHVVPGLTTRDGLTRQVGAVNTVRATEMGWEGINTDVPGFLDPLAARMELWDQRATVLGAGGAARGVAVALAREGAHVCVCARNSDRAAEVARLVDGTVGPIPPNSNSWDLLVNTTPVGTFPDVDASPLPGGPFGKGLVYDLVYNPPVTRLMAEASAAGCDTIGGLPMLVAQAVRQFEWWTGTVAPVKVFRQAAEGAALGIDWDEVSTRVIAMIDTTFEEFTARATQGTFVPVCKEVMADLLTPVSAFLKVAELSEHAFLLESVEGGERVARYSFLGKDPFMVLRARDGRTIIERGTEQEESSEPFMETLRKVMNGFRSASVSGLPRFTGGAVGCLGYEAAGWFEPSLERSWEMHGKVSAPGSEDAGFMLFDTILAFDHVKHRIVLIANAAVGAGKDLSEQYGLARAKISFLEAGARADAFQTRRAAATAARCTLEYQP